jgi:hypothetical protein
VRILNIIAVKHVVDDGRIVGSGYGGVTAGCLSSQKSVISLDIVDQGLDVARKDQDQSNDAQNTDDVQTNENI